MRAFFTKMYSGASSPSIMGKAIRNSVIVILCVTLAFYVHKSWVKYDARHTALSIKEEHIEVFEFPAITVCAYDIDWFDKNPSPKSFTGLLENPSTNGPRILASLLAANETYRFDSATDKENFTLIPGAVYTEGKWAARLCTSFSPKKTASAKMGMDNSIILNLNISKEYSYFTFYAHEENSFVPSRSNLLAATEVKVAPPESRVQYLEAELSRSVIKKVPMPGRECKETVTNAQLDITACIVGNIESILGCRLPWSNYNNTASSSDSSICTDDKFAEFTQLLAGIYYLNENDIFVDKCDPSCTYNKYEVNVELVKSVICREGIQLCTLPANIYMVIQMNEPSTVIQEEFLIYELSDLVADFGGYLGLLLGASLYTIFELSEMLVEKLRGHGRSVRK